MASTGVNVLRWSALGLGVFYGLYHQTAINSSDKTAALNKEYERKQQLIDQARAAYAKKNAPKETKSTSGGVVTDLSDPKFDLEAYIKTADA